MKVVLYLASFPSMFFVMEMVGGGDLRVLPQETVELIHDNTTILVEMLLCCVVVVVSCCLFVALGDGCLHSEVID